MASAADALSSAVGAAEYLKQLNSSSYTTVDEAQTIASAMKKWSLSLKSSREFLDAWKGFKGYSEKSDAAFKSAFGIQIELGGNGGSDYDAAQKNVNSYGNLIYDNAVAYVKQQETQDAKLKSDYDYGQLATTAANSEASAKAQSEYDNTAKQAQYYTPYKVRTTTSVTARSAPVIDKKNVLGTVTSGTILSTATDNASGAWTKVTWKGAPAYISTQYVKEVSETVTNTATGKTKVTTKTTTTTTAKKPVSVAVAATGTPAETGMSTASKFLIGGGALAVIGIIAAIARKKK